MGYKLRSIAIAAALATICLAPLLEGLIRPNRDLVYHWGGRPSLLFVPALLELLVLTAVFGCVLWSARRSGYWRALIWTAIIVFLPWLLFRQADRMWTLPGWLRLPPYWVPTVLWPVIAISCYRLAVRRWEAVIEAVSAILAFTALSGMLCVVQILWVWWGARNLNASQPVLVASTDHVKMASPRIIWIVLDELSYEQVYEHRYPGLQLPAFDALAADSTVFTKVIPTSNRTERALPALLSGRPVQDMRATPDGMLLVRSSATRPWQHYGERDTVLGDARRAGYSTALVGWYNPYCRILPDVLNYCYWSNADAIYHGVNPDSTMTKNLISSTGAFLTEFGIGEFLNGYLHVPHSFNEPEGHLKDYVRLNARAHDVLLDRTMTFTFLHLPIPHPDGIYNRRSEELTPTGGTYIDNLALADRWLAQTRALLESTGQWDNSTVIVMGDHGWRTKMIWEHMGKWTAEEQRASLGGQFDSRPGYIVKLAGQQSGERIDESFDAIRTRALMDELIDGRIRSTQDLKSWVDHGRETNQNYALNVRH